MNARGDLLPRTEQQMIEVAGADNFRGLLRRQTPPLEKLQLLSGTMRWAYEHARRGLPVPRIQPPVQQLLDVSSCGNV